LAILKKLDPGFTAEHKVTVPFFEDCQTSSAWLVVRTTATGYPQNNRVIGGIMRDLITDFAPWLAIAAIFVATSLVFAGTLAMVPR
jgi:hypothetical protein